MSNKRKKIKYYWICDECGKKYSGKKHTMISTYHDDFCNVCGEFRSVTEGRDWGWVVIYEDQVERIKNSH